MSKQSLAFLVRQLRMIRSQLGAFNVLERCVDAADNFQLLSWSGSAIKRTQSWINRLKYQVSLSSAHRERRYLPTQVKQAKVAGGMAVGLILSF
jgi:hypothetical protein